MIPASEGTFPVDGKIVADITRAAEQSGFDSLWVGEHVIMSPRETYPGANVNRVGPSSTGTLPDPLDWLSYAAAISETVLLGTSILLLPLHNPLIMAKRLSTLDQLSRGRVRLGIGVGWSEDEYAAVGVDYRTRGRRCDEAIDAMRALWAGESASYDGRFFRFDGVNSFPQPVHGAVPILVGGDSEAAARRAGRTGDGYFPFGKDLGELRHLVDVVRRTAADAGRDPDAIELTALGSRRREHVAELADIGFTRMVLFSKELTAESVEQLGEQAQAIVAGL